MPRPPNIPQRKLPTPVKSASQENQLASLIAQGLALHQQGKFNEAKAFYEKVLGIQKNNFGALQLLGALSVQTKQFTKAVDFLTKAILINPNHADSYSNRGMALNELKRFDKALESCDRAIGIKPDYAEAYSNRGIALQELKRLDEAIQSFDRAIGIKPNYADAYLNRGISLKELRRLDESIASYFQALQLNPDCNFLLGTLQYTKMLICDWNDFDRQENSITNKINSLQKTSNPLEILAINDSPKTHQLCAQVYAQDRYPINHIFLNISKHLKQEKIRIGYFSADFCNHPVSYLTAELFETHNKNEFETIAFSFGSAEPDEMRSRLSKSFNQFIDVRDQSDQAVAQLARDMEIDVAVDLGGHTNYSRTGIFAFRAAPIQLSYIGYLGTMGAEYFDYLIADSTIIPTSSQQYYSEKIIYLPSYQVNDGKRVIANKKYTRQELGLPDIGFVFCCFNQNYKILPSTFDGWMRILKAVKDSVLFLYAGNHWAEANLKKEAQARGVDSQRLVFGKPIAREAYLARYQTCDLFLDTLPYNAGTTASDALWAGLPVLTLMGESFASRVAASLLNAIDLPELITTSQAEYEALAIEIATNPQQLNAIKQKLFDNRLTTPLFDTRLFTKNLEAAYTQIMERYWADLPPNHIYIKS